MEKLYLAEKAFQRGGFVVEIFNTKNEAAKRIYEMVNSGVIGFGNSQTVRDIGIIEMLKSNKNVMYFHFPGIESEDERKSFFADFYLTSANAVSIDGQIVNIDGTGNRVAATSYGPKHIIYVIGKNKICNSLEEALDRAKNVAAVTLAKKYKIQTPCTITGKCENCHSKMCICSIITIHRHKQFGSDVSIILIDEDLGI